jgi:methyl halide transferase
MSIKTIMADPAPGKLQETFRDVGFAKHGSKWHGLWEESYTPWDRGGPSLALYDLLVGRKDLVPPAQIFGSSGSFTSPTSPSSPGSPSSPNRLPRKKNALVPGCGRGHDVLLLSAMGYDVYGLDYSETAIKQARKVERDAENELSYSPREGMEKGRVTWLTGDFFQDDFLKKAGLGQFDLIFDYTVSSHTLCVSFLFYH